MNSGKEGTGSMGDDTPLAAFTDSIRPFSDFFKQKFAQVTNPPIDPIREKVVMSLNVRFGEMRNILDETPEHARSIKLVSPILMQDSENNWISYFSVTPALTHLIQHHLMNHLNWKLVVQLLTLRLVKQLIL